MKNKNTDRNSHKQPVHTGERFPLARYELDPNGNRRTVSFNEQQYVFTTVPGTNRLQSANGPAFTKTYSYDPAGNVTSDGIHSYGYDARGLFTSLNNDQYRYGINALGQ